MTANPAPVNDLTADQIAAENNASRPLFGDNPNPDQGKTADIPPPPADDAEGDAPRQLSARELIAERAKAARRAAEGEPVDTLDHNEMGEHVPAWVKNLDAEPAAEDVPPPATEEPKTFKIKVRGNEHEVSFEELAKLAGLEADEAKDIPTISLVKAAQLTAAAEGYFTEAKQAHKSSRVAAREESDATLSDDDAATDQDDASTDRRAQHQGDDWHRETIQKIQFGSEEEAAEALRDAMVRGVNEVLTERQMTDRVTTVNTYINRAAAEFEEANADLVEDPDLANALYNGALIREFKKDLVAGGVKPENADRVLGSDIATAMKAYVAVATDGRVKIRTPDLMLAAAGEATRAKFNRPVPNREAASQTAFPPAHDRTAAKRALAPQPNRASVPAKTAAPKNGQEPAARSSVVAKMQAARGRSSAI